MQLPVSMRAFNFTFCPVQFMYAAECSQVKGVCSSNWNSTVLIVLFSLTWVCPIVGVWFCSSVVES